MHVNETLGTHEVVPGSIPAHYRQHMGSLHESRTGLTNARPSQAFLWSLLRLRTEVGVREHKRQCSVKSIVGRPVSVIGRLPRCGNQPKQSG